MPEEDIPIGFSWKYEDATFVVREKIADTYKVSIYAGKSLIGAKPTDKLMGADEIRTKSAEGKADESARMIRTTGNRSMNGRTQQRFQLRPSTFRSEKPAQEHVPEYVAPIVFRSESVTPKAVPVALSQEAEKMKRWHGYHQRLRKRGIEPTINLGLNLA